MSSYLVFSAYEKAWITFSLIFPGLTSHLRQIQAYWIVIVCVAALHCDVTRGSGARLRLEPESTAKKMDCKIFEPLITNTGFLLVVGSQAFAGAFSAVVALIALRKCRTLHFHVNCRILLTTLLLLYIVHSVCITVLQTLQLVRYVLHPDPCEAAISSALCFSLRFPSTICMTSFAVLQLGMIVERAVALWKRDRYETYGSVVGTAITFCCMISSVSVTTWALIQMNLHTETVYCSAGTQETGFRVKVLSFILCAIDFITLLGTGFVFAFNVAAIRRKFFDLKSSYQLKENISVIRIILPLSIFQAICHTMFSMTNGIISSFESSFSMVTYRTLFAATYIIPYYTMVAPLLLLYVLNRSLKDRALKLKVLTRHVTNENDVYFTAYSQMWNNRRASNKC
ncbi:hypothetical protein Y032_0066g3748 [Ancylostoma ceylanicum]|nr:hypothetical protein Y032_0066g3748 [Ancylostoma ceylanicum]